jgi:hypothetical protein
MQNSYEEDFKKKYLKYKSKYLELKDLLKGGIPLGLPADSKFWTKEQKDKCTKYDGTEKCELISQNCKENKLYKKDSKFKFNKCSWDDPSLSELLKRK